jgi:hypothetical protein
MAEIPINPKLSSVLGLVAADLKRSANVGSLLNALCTSSSEYVGVAPLNEGVSAEVSGKAGAAGARPKAPGISCCGSVLNLPVSGLPYPTLNWLVGETDGNSTAGVLGVGEAK